MLACTAPVAGHAQDLAAVSEYQLSIPAQPLGSALNAFARETGLRFAYPAELVIGKSSPGLSGNYSRSGALSRLLSGTGLQFQISGTTVTLRGAGQVNAAEGGNEDLQLGTIILPPGTDRTIVSGSGYQGTPDWVYNTPESVSVLSKDAIKDSQPRDSGDLFTGMAGVATAGATQNPGISVNIRGLQDQNRVTSTIDGARQNFQLGGHGYTSNVYVDPSLLRMVEVEKSGTTGVGAGGSHGGVVNYRTVEADDILEPGKTYGGEVNLSSGTNEYKFNGTAAFAAQVTDTVDVLAALSHKSLGAYDIGQNGAVPAGVSDIYDEANGEAVFTGSDTWSGLLKAGWDIAPDQRLTFGFVGYDAEFTTSTVNADYKNTNHVRNLTGTLTYDWTPADPLVDLHARLWFNRTENEQYREARSGYGAFDVGYAIDSLGVSVENTSRFSLPSGEVALHYGLEAFKDTTATAVVNYDEDDAGNDSWYTGPNPNGERTLFSGFLRATYEQSNVFEAWLGGRYDYYDLSGQTSYYGCLELDPRGRCARSDRVTLSTDVGSNGGAFTPEIGAAWTIRNGFQLFGQYSGGYRPPSMAEALLGGAHIGNILRYAPNPNLRAETSQNWEIGANFSYDNIFRDEDAFRLKATVFDRRVDDFIALGLVSGTPDYDNALEFGGFQYVNLDGPTTLRGLELEGNYDAGSFYFGASFTHTKGDYPSTYNSDPWGNGNPSFHQVYYIFVAPEYKISLDAGLRLVDDRLKLGTRVTHIIPAEQQGLNAMAYKPETYTTMDLYGTYNLRENATLRFAINNVTDVAYVDPLNSADFLGPGRTATISLNMRF
ncbi:TonB-dependent receptor [Sulfitobacter sp. DFL-23]|nr:TonB-dependent receptor [Sulfitobacter sp. DFL-23]